MCGTGETRAAQLKWAQFGKALLRPQGDAVLGTGENGATLMHYVDVLLTHA
jgi:hypothetical protein